MIDQEKLAEILSRAKTAATPQHNAVRKLKGSDAKGRLTAILTEIDETMLPRALNFTREDGAQLVVEVRARRAVRFGDISGNVPQSETYKRLAEGGTTGEALCAAMSHVIFGFSESEGQLNVQSLPSNLPPSIVDKGFEADDLAKAAGSPAPATDDSPPPAPAKTAEIAAIADAADALFAAADGSAQSHLMANNEGEVTSNNPGDGKLPPEALAKRLASQISMTAPFMDGVMPGRRLVVMANRSNDAPALCFASDKAGIAAASVARTDLTGVIANWSKGANRSG